MSYITIQDIRNVGLSDVDYPDAEVQASIDLWQIFIDRACKQWFEPRAMTFEMDGTDSDMLFFKIPIISINWIKINNCTEELDQSYYKVYSRLDDYADRWAPRIKLINSTEYSDIYTAPEVGRRNIFRKGNKNQIVDGVFGFVESDQSTPLPIQRALTKLVVEKLTSPIYNSGGSSGGGSTPVTGPIKEEWTDGHKIKYATAGGDIKPSANGLSGITNDPEILTILKLYKAPPAMAVPASPSYNR